jgi:hypothetical protein
MVARHRLDAALEVEAVPFARAVEVVPHRQEDVAAVDGSRPG